MSDRVVLSDNQALIQAAAWAPGHITGFFKISDDAAGIIHRGSLGAGLSLEKGCTTTCTIPVKEENNRRQPDILINGIPDAAPVSRRVMELFYRRTGITVPAGLTVRHSIEVPFGAGFGSSGAGAFSLALALNALHDSPLSETGAGQIAHCAEAESRTGLGTVLGDTVGGLEVRTKPGAPGIGEVVSFPQLSQAVVFACVFGPLPTKSALSDPVTRTKIIDACGTSLNAMLGNAGIANYLQLSRRFAERTGLISKNAREAFNLLDEQNIPATMTMFGDVVYTVADVSLRRRILGVFSKVKIPHIVFESRLAETGAHVINEY